MTEYTTI